MKIKSFIICLIILSISNLISAQKKYTLQSPDKRTNVSITIGNDFLKYSVTHDDVVIINDSPITMELSDGKS